MTAHYMPAEPDLDTLWTRRAHDETVVRWTRGTNADGAQVWQSETEDTVWSALLAFHGPVFEQHPSLVDGAPTPWTATYDDEDILQAYDALGDRVDLALDDVVAVIVPAVNAYAERLLGEQLAHRVEAVPGVRVSPALGYALRELVEMWEQAADAPPAAPGALRVVLDKIADRYRKQQDIARANGAGQ